MSPWELLERPMAWTHWAKMAESAEINAKNQQQESAQRKQRAGG